MTYKEPKHKQDTGVSFEASVFVWTDEGGPMVPSSAGFHTPGPVECGQPPAGFNEPAAAGSRGKRVCETTARYILPSYPLAVRYFFMK